MVWNRTTYQSANTIPNHTIKKAIAEYLNKYPQHRKQLIDEKSLLKIIELREKDLKSMWKRKNKVNKVNDQEIGNNSKLDKEVLQFLTDLNLTQYIDVFAKEGCI